MKAMIKEWEDIDLQLKEIDSNGDYNFETVDCSPEMLDNIKGYCGQWIEVSRIDDDDDFKFLHFNGTYPKEIIGALKFADAEEFEAMYELETNHITGDDAVVFDSYGKELEYVLSISNTEPNRVWTCIDGDYGLMYITKGYHLINRFGYYITKKSCPFEVWDTLYI